MFLYSGIIDDLAYFDHALTQERIRSHIGTVGYMRKTKGNLDKRNAIDGDVTTSWGYLDAFYLQNPVLTSSRKIWIGFDIGYTGLFSKVKITPSRYFCELFSVGQTCDINSG